MIMTRRTTQEECLLGPGAATPYTADSSNLQSRHLANRHCAKMAPVQMDASSMLGYHQLLQEQLLCTIVHKSRPKSAAVTAAAWKAYGSPSLKGHIRPPAPPSPAHPRTRQGPGPDPMSSRTPSIGILGGGFTYPCAGTRIQSSPQVPAASSLPPRSPKRMQALHVGESVAAVPHLMQATHNRAMDLLSGVLEQHPDDAQEYRYSPTRPTDPTAQRVWSQLVSRTAASSHRPARPQSACPAIHIQTPPQSMNSQATRGKPRPVSASARFSSLKVGTVHHLGARYVPPAVPGHGDPVQEHPLPQPGDARWVYSRVGGTALARLQTSIKMPMSMAQHTGSPGRPVSPTHLSITTLTAGQLNGAPDIDLPSSLDLTPAPDKSGPDTASTVLDLYPSQPAQAPAGQQGQPGGDSDAVADTEQHAAQPFWCTEADAADLAELPGLLNLGDVLVTHNAHPASAIPLPASSEQGAEISGLPTAAEPGWAPDSDGIGTADIGAAQGLLDYQGEPITQGWPVASGRPGTASHRPASARPWSATPASSAGAANQDPQMYAIEEGSGDDEDVMV